MATSGTNYTGKWTLSNGVLTLAPVSGSSGQFRAGYRFSGDDLTNYISLTDDEKATVRSIVSTGSLVFYYNENIMGDAHYVPIKDFHYFFHYFPNVETIDIRGIKNSDVTDFHSMFWCEKLTSIIGLDTLDVSKGSNFQGMFEYSLLDSLDLSEYPLNTAKNFNGIIFHMPYLRDVTFPPDMNRQSNGDTWKGNEYYLGLAPATNENGITVRKDEDFFKLPEGQQGGTWTRDISGTAKLKFSVSTVTREAETADIDYSYATTSATATVYLKKSSESSFPSTPSTTFTLAGTGRGTVTVTLPTDDSHDAWIVVTDGNETIYTYPSIDSNVLLMSVNKDGNAVFPTNVHAGGTISAMGSISTESDITAEGDVDANGNITSGGTVTDGDGYSIPHYSSQVITSYNSGWTVYTSGAANEIRVQKFGRICVLSGIMKNTAAKTINTTEQTMFTLPEGFRPNKLCKALCQGSDTATWVLTVNTGGTVTASRYRLHSSTYPSVASGSWFPFHIAYMVD